MGLDETATHLIWLFAGLAVLGMGAQVMDVVQEISDARAASDRLEQARLSTRIDGPTFCYRPATDQVMLVATNSGDVWLPIDGFTFLLDGQAFTGPVVSDSGSALWGPGEEVVLTLEGVTAQPSRVAFSTGHGVPAYPAHVECPVLSTIVVSPEEASLLVGTSRTFSAQGYDQYGRLMPDTVFSWSSTGGTMVALDGSSARLDAGTVAGTFTVTASSSGVSGNATVTLTPDAPVSIMVSPDPVGVAAGATVPFQATLLDRYGNENTTTPVSWSTNAGAITSGGVLTAQTLAQAGLSVTATAGSLSDSAAVDVHAAAPARIVVSPATTSLLAGATATFSATPYDAYDNVNASAPVAWSAARGTVTSAGVYTAPALRGADTVTATSGSASGTAAVTVTQSVHVDALGTFQNGVADATFARGETFEMRATVRDHNGNLVEGVTVTFEVRRPSNQVDSTWTDATDASGVASVSYTLSGTAQRNEWTIRVTGITGADIAYDSAANAVTQVTFRVS